MWGCSKCLSIKSNVHKKYYQKDGTVVCKDCYKPEEELKTDSNIQEYIDKLVDNN